MNILSSGYTTIYRTDPAGGAIHFSWSVVMGIETGGIFGLIVLVADIWAIVNIVGSSATTGVKTLWVLLVLPLVGFILWFLIGPKSIKNN